MDLRKAASAYGWQLLLGAAAVFVTGCGRDAEPLSRKPAHLPRAPPTELKLMISAPQILSEGEDVRLVRIPSPWAPDMREMDSACLIYRNSTLHAAHFVCPGGAPGMDNFVEMQGD